MFAVPAPPPIQQLPPEPQPVIEYAMPVRDEPAINQDFVFESPRRRRSRSQFRCPYCGCREYPLRIRRISTAGWIVAVILLVTTGCLFWIGLLIKEERSTCPNCGVRLD
jgi:hypothetical protein